MTLLFTCGAGLVLEERDDKLGVFITDIDSTQLAACDKQDNPGSLSQAILTLLFMAEELARGCAIKPRKEGVEKVHAKCLHTIRGISLVPRFRPKNQEKGLVLLLCIFC